MGNNPLDAWVLAGLVVVAVALVLRLIWPVIEMIVAIVWTPVRVVLIVARPLRPAARTAWRVLRMAHGEWRYRRRRMSSARALYELMRDHRHDELYPVLREEADKRELMEVK